MKNAKFKSQNYGAGYNVNISFCNLHFSFPTRSVHVAQHFIREILLYGHELLTIYAHAGRIRKCLRK